MEICSQTVLCNHKETDGLNEITQTGGFGEKFCVFFSRGIYQPELFFFLIYSTASAQKSPSAFFCFFSFSLRDSQQLSYLHSDTSVCSVSRFIKSLAHRLRVIETDVKKRKKKLKSSFTSRPRVFLTVASPLISAQPSGTSPQCSVWGESVGVDVQKRLKETLRGVGGGGVCACACTCVSLIADTTAEKVVFL